MSTEDEKIRHRLAEILSSGGVGYNQVSLEILYLLPTEFVNRYIWLWEKALGSAGSADKGGTQLAHDAELGRHKTETSKKGQKIGAGTGGTGKKWKKIGMTIKDEKALELKGRVDRRLRSIARDIRQFELDAGRGGRGKDRAPVQCKACGRMMDDSWVHCPFDGRVIDIGKAEG